MNLTDFNLSELDKYVFTTLTNLVHIDLSRNQLKKLDQHIFYDLNVLKEENINELQLHLEKFIEESKSNEENPSDEETKSEKNVKSKNQPFKTVSYLENKKLFWEIIKQQIKTNFFIFL